MAKGISIGVGADTRQFSQAVSRGVVEPLEDVEKALDGVGDDSEKAGDKLVDSMRDAQRQTDRLKDEHKKLGDVIDAESRRGGRSIRENTAESSSAARESLNEVGDEAKSNLSEMVSSFDGSMDSVADLAQGTLGGLVGSMGPLGVAVGAAGALAIGAVMGMINQASEDTEAYKERVSELGQEFITAGLNGETSIEFLVDKLQELAAETDDVSLKELAKVAKDSGRDFTALAQAYAGNTDNLAELIAESKQYQRALDAEAAAATNGVYDQDALYAAKKKQADAQRQYTDYLVEAEKVAADAAQTEQNYIDAGGRAMETRAKGAETYQEALDNSLGAFDDFKDAETGALDPAAYLAGIQARIDATGSFNSNVQSIATQFGLTDAEVQAILDQGLDFAPMLQSIIDSGLAPEFVSQLQSAVGGGQDILDGNPLNTTAQVDADTGKATEATDAFTQTKRETTIDAKANTKPAEDAIRATANAPYQATIAVHPDLVGAEAQLTRFMNRDRRITITAEVVDRAGRLVD